MNGRNAFRILAALLLVGVAAAVVVFAYNAGVAQGLAAGGEPNPPAGAIGPYRGYGGPFFFAPFGFFFGLLGLLLLVFLIVGLVRALTWRGPGAWGDRGRWREGAWWAGGAPPSFEEWHRRAHAQRREEARDGESDRTGLGGHDEQGSGAPPETRA